MTEDLRRYTRYAEKKVGTQNKFYEVEAEELENKCGRVTFRWGRIGANGQTKVQDVFTYALAQRMADNQFATKLEKGYVEVTAMQALASAVEDLDERKTNGLEPVNLTIPRFHAGKSEDRCVQFCRKWSDKLNVIRRSRWDMGLDDYERQMTRLLKGYCKEWKRICGTKSHGHLADNAAAQTAFRIFFSALRDNTKCYVYGYFEGVGSAG